MVEGLSGENGRPQRPSDGTIAPTANRVDLLDPAKTDGQFSLDDVIYHQLINDVGGLQLVS